MNRLPKNKGLLEPQEKMVNTVHRFDTPKKGCLVNHHTGASDMSGNSAIESRADRIAVPLSVLNFKDDALDFVENSGATKPEKDFLVGVLELAHIRRITDSVSDLDEYVSFSNHELSEFLEERKVRGSSVKSVKRKCDSLKKVGFFRRNLQQSPMGGVPIKTYVLLEIHDPEFETVDQTEMRERAQGHRNTRTKTTKAILKQLRASDAQLVSHVKNIRSVSETLFTGVFDRAMRFTTRDVVPNNRITTKVRVRNTTLHVQATTQTGATSELAALTDQRVIRAVLSEVAHFIENEIEKYIFDVEKPRQESLFGEDEQVIDYGFVQEDGDESGLSDGTVLPKSITPELVTSIVEDTVDSEDARKEQVITQAKQQREELEKAAVQRIQNSFFIDVVSIAKRMEYAQPYSSSTRRFINASLRRLYETNFRMVIEADKDNPSDALTIMELFGLEDLKTDFRFLSELKSQYEKDFVPSDASGLQPEVIRTLNNLPQQVHLTGKELLKSEKVIDPFDPEELKRVRVWRLSLDNYLFKKLMIKELRKLYTAHPDIMKESSGLGQTLYNLFTQTIGRTDKRSRGEKENFFNISLSDLHNLLWPTRKYFRFEEEIIELMKRYVKSTPWDDTLKFNRVSMFGYVFTLTRKPGEPKGKQLWLHVERDRNDDLAGDNSFYNRNVNRKRGAVTGAFRGSMH